LYREKHRKTKNRWSSYKCTRKTKNKWNGHQPSPYSLPLITLFMEAVSTPETSMRLHEAISQKTVIFQLNMAPTCSDSDKIKDELGGTCRTHGGDKCMHNYDLKNPLKRHTLDERTILKRV
jgi:hypothetical protein